MKRIIHYIKRNKIKSSVLFLLIVWYVFCLPQELFNKPTSTVIVDSENELLGALIAADGQWRFPKTNEIPEKFKTCVIQFEDEYFYNHPGFNPISMLKALRKNVSAGKVKRGGSTLTQQVIKLSRNQRKRTYLEKLKEVILATRLELRTSKDEILALWSSNAPFGGNVVGLDAASWRYFNRKPSDLSWAESATLAVLPNAPNLIYPGKNQKKLLAKRNRLLKKLMTHKIIDSLTYNLSLSEELPQKPYPLPQIAPHLLQKVHREDKGSIKRVSIDKNLQDQVNSIVKRHYMQLQQNEIYNAAVLVLDIEERKVLAYVGNTPTDRKHQKDVDVIDKPRSTGSILKPLLYAAMLDDGQLLPEMLLPDIPTQIGNYRPENYTKEYTGAISAKKALSMSLNIPAVKMLQKYGVNKFHHYLRAMSLRDVGTNPNRYGLSLILGGAESNLWDLCSTYAAFASTLSNYTLHNGWYYSNEFVTPSYTVEDKVHLGELVKHKEIFDAASIYLTFESMKDLNRPGVDQNWKFFDSSNAIAWKTGTSFGFRDAWAIGVTKKYVVGIWVGNADGEGRPGLVGVQTAAPILFDVFDKLPKSEWFETPIDAMYQVSICKKSGYKASEFCDESAMKFVQASGLRTKVCPYHIAIFMDKTETYQVNNSCENVENITKKSWFVLPPAMEYYYKQRHPLYKEMPRFKGICSSQKESRLSFIYPKESEGAYLPKDFNGKKSELVFKVAHSLPNTAVYWYLNDTYLGRTNEIHDMAIQPRAGIHRIMVIDQFGTEISRQIEIKG